MRHVRKDLREWLGYIRKLQAVAHGRIPGNVAVAKAALAKSSPVEDAMAVELIKIIRKTDPTATPPADLISMAACVLAPEANSPAAQGIVPLLVLGGVVVVVISTIARGIVEKAKNDRYMDCVESGACPPPSQWKKLFLVGGGLVVGWFLWTRTNVLSVWKA